MRPIQALSFGATTIAAATLSTAATAEETRTYDVDGFEAVSTSAGVEAIVTVGEGYSVVAEGSEDALDRLDVEVRGEELRLGRKKKSGWNWGRSGGVTVRVTTPRLTALDGSSGSSIEASGVEADDFVIDASSGSAIDVVGTCGALVVDASSGSSIDADQLECRSVVADASSGASIDVYAGESIVADASSGASIDVDGGPEKVIKDTSSGASVRVRRK